MNEQQEREAFEKWFSTQPDAQGFSYGQHVARPDGTYEWPYKQELWECWKARASQPVPSGLTDEQRDAVEYTQQVLRQVEAGDGTFVGQCADAISGLEALLSTPHGDKQ